MQIESMEIVVGGLTSLLGALISFWVGRRKAKNSDFDVLIKANEQFRSEVRNELADARRTIEELRLAMKDKDKEVEELKNSISDLHNEIIEKDRRISDLKIDLMQKDIQMAEISGRLTLLDQK
jgi:predicted RNase H-like nuclease (RuvC/YqgF family)